MARKKKSSSPKRPFQTKAALKRVAGWFEQGGVETALEALPLALVVVVFGVGGVAAWHRASRQERFLVEATSLRLDQWPAWCTAPLAERINGSVQLQSSMNCLDSGVTRKIAAAYAASSWVRRVRFVRKRFPNHVQIGVELRKPVLAVPRGGVYYLVDRDAVLLPVAYAAWPVREVQVPTLKAARVSPPPPRGSVWQDEAVLDAVAVLGAVATCEKMKPLKLAEVDLSNLRGRVDPRKSEIVLVTDTQARICWGRSPRTAPFGEYSVDEKVATLSRLLSRNPRPVGVNLVVRFANGG